jgi:hypothetical protein
LSSSYFRFDTTAGSSLPYATPFSGTNQAVITSQSVAVGESNKNWERLEGGEGSSGQEIHVQVDLEMQSFPQTPQDSDGSRTDLVRLSRGRNFQA